MAETPEGYSIVIASSLDEIEFDIDSDTPEEGCIRFLITTADGQKLAVEIAQPEIATIAQATQAVMKRFPKGRAAH